MEPVFLKSKKNFKILQHNDYLYRISKRAHGRTYWMCTTSHCKAGMILDREHKMILSTNGVSHNHPANPGEIVKRKFYEDIRRTIFDNPNTPIPEIYREAVSKLSGSEFFSQIPTFDAMRNFLYNSRKHLKRTLPKAADNLELNSILRVTSNGMSFKKTDARLGARRVEESDCLLPNRNPEQIECVVDYSPNQLMEEKHCHDVETSNTNLTLQIQKRMQYSPGRQKSNNSDNSPEHIECSVDFHPSQFSVDVEVNQCQDGQITDANKNLETQRKPFLPDEKFIKRENSPGHSVYLPNQLVEHKNEESDCRVVQVVDEHVNKKRKLNSQEEQIEDLYSLSLPDTTRKDEFHVFGDYVASELRKLSHRALALAKHNINNILFEANIGKYDSPSTSSS